MTAIPSTPAPSRSLRHPHWLRRAWISVAALPVAAAAAILVGNTLLSSLGYASAEGLPLRAILLAGVPATLIGMVPAALAVWFGLRARDAGDERGLLPAVIGGVAIAYWLLSPVPMLVSTFVGG